MKLLDLYKKAIKEKYAIGAFNFSNMEQLKAIVNASNHSDTPVICAVSESAIKYMGINLLMAMFKVAKKQSHTDIYLHLDHGKTFDICKTCIDAGFDSVMIDGSSLPFSKNIELTKQVCTYAHSKGIQVEGELGTLSGIEDDVSGKNNYTDPQKAKEFVEKTGVDSLAIAIGTSHGAYKFSGTPKLEIDLLKQIENVLPNFPLVLHGSSSVPEEQLNKFNKFGGTLDKAVGIPESILHTVCTNNNIVKINVDTDIRITMTAEIRKVLSEDTKCFDVRKYLGNSVIEVEKLVFNKITTVFK